MSETVNIAWAAESQQAKAAAVPVVSETPEAA